MRAPSTDALAAAGRALAEAELGIRRGTVREAALRALRPGGPSLDELEQRIAARRAADHQTPAGATRPAPAGAHPVAGTPGGMGQRRGRSKTA